MEFASLSPAPAHARGEAAALKPFKDARILVIGGGYGGVAAAVKLKDKCQLTLIDGRDAFHHNMGAQRSAVETGDHHTHPTPPLPHYHPYLHPHRLQQCIRC